MSSNALTKANGKLVWSFPQNSTFCRLKRPLFHSLDFNPLRITTIFSPSYRSSLWTGRLKHPTPFASSVDSIVKGPQECDTRCSDWCSSEAASVGQQSKLNSLATKGDFLPLPNPLLYPLLHVIFLLVKSCLDSYLHIHKCVSLESSSLLSVISPLCGLLMSLQILYRMKNCSTSCKGTPN